MVRVACGLAAVGFLALVACAQDAEPDTPAEPTRTPIEQAVWDLAGEARETQLHRELPPKPDYADRNTHDLDPEAVADAILRRHFVKVFFDAYARWQLTSFDPPVHVADDEAMQLIVRQGPGLAQNPWSSARTVRLFKAMVDMGVLGDQEKTYVLERQGLLDADTSLITTFNRPMLEVRAWIGSRLTDPVHKAYWLISDCVAHAGAGWPVRDTDLEKQVDESLAAIAADAAISDERKQRLAQVIRYMTETDRDVVTNVVFEDDDSLNASIIRAGVGTDTVQRWAAVLVPPAAPETEAPGPGPTKP